MAIAAALVLGACSVALAEPPNVPNYYDAHPWDGQGAVLFGNAYNQAPLGNARNRAPKAQRAELCNRCGYVWGTIKEDWSAFNAAAGRRASIEGRNAYVRVLGSGAIEGRNAAARPPVMPFTDWENWWFKWATSKN